jgi:hypothetical protein
MIFLLILTKGVVHKDLETEGQKGPGILRAALNLGEATAAGRISHAFIYPGPAYITSMLSEMLHAN